MGKVLPTDRGYKAANLFKERLLEHYRPAHIFPDCGPDSSTEQAFSGGTSLRTQNRCSIISATQFFSDSGFGDDWAGRLALRMPSCPKDADPHLPEIWQHLSRFEEEHLPSIQTGPQGGDDFNDSIHRGDFFSAAAVSTIRLVTFICVHLPQTKLGSGYFRTVCEIVQFVSYLKAHGVTGAYSRPLGDFLSEYAAISEIAEALYEPCWVGLHFRDPLYARQYPAALGRQTFHRWLDTIKERTLASSGSNADIENFQSEFDKVKQSNKLAQYDPKDAKAKFDLIFCHEPTLLDALASMQALDYDTKVPDSSVVCIELLSRSDFDSVHDQWFGRVMFQNVPRKLPVPNSTSCWAYLCIYTLVSALLTDCFSCYTNTPLSPSRMRLACISVLKRAVSINLSQLGLNLLNVLK